MKRTLGVALDLRMILAKVSLNTGAAIHPEHTYTAGVGMAKLQYGVIKAAAEASGYHPGYISRIVNGHMPWRKSRLPLLSALYQNGWEPPEGVQFLEEWIRLTSVPTAVPEWGTDQEPNEPIAPPAEQANPVVGAQPVAEARSISPILLTRRGEKFGNSTRSRLAAAAVAEAAAARLAAAQGNALAQYLLGLAYANGEGVPEDKAEAVKWFRLAAAQGDELAQASLGSAYYLGIGVAEDKAEAVKWYRLAAAQGDAIAQYFVGRAYHLGEGVPEDYVQAYKWYNLAAASGYTRAKSGKGLVAKNMTTEEITEAQRLSTLFTPTKTP